MSTIHATLHDAEQYWNLREESAKLRLKELKDLAYDAEDVIEEYEYEVNRCRVEAFERCAADLLGARSSSSSKRMRHEVHDNYYTIEAGIVPVPRELAHGARKIIERFTELKQYSNSFTLSENDGERRIVPDIHIMRQSSSIVYTPRILGRGDDKDQVVQKLMSRSSKGSRFGSHMSVLAIVGMGGLGKTTLAQLVYNDIWVRQSYDLHAWVCVSEYFSVENITRKIITSLTRNPCHHIHDGSLQGKLGDLVNEKKVLLVLDDVWNERSDCWELLCMPLLASRLCDIIVTTRSKVVARLVQTKPFYNLNCLSPDDSWSLFKQATFLEQEIISRPNLVEIGRSITEKCKGLPLAIKTLGSILRYDTDESRWRDVLDSEQWDLKQSRNEVLPALELSYKYMHMHLRRCFVSLSLFRKDIYLDEHRVVSLWKLLDLLQCDGSDDKDEIGSLYFNELVQRSLLQNYIEGDRVIMHDLVHDLACFLAGDEFFRLEGDKQTEIPRGARYLSILLRNNSIPISNESESLRVITMIEGISDVENPEVLFLSCKKFRVIDVSQCKLAEAILDFLSDMKLLRHLSVTGYKDAALPSYVFKLFNLRTLNIEAYMLQGMGRLVNLLTMPEIHLRRCGSFFDIRDLRNMNNIRKLVMDGLCEVSIAEANEAHLHSKNNLETLELDFNRWEEYDTDRTISGVELLESLRPHHHSLKVLRLKNFNFDAYPSWLGSTSFSVLTELELYNCQSQHCPTLGELPSLKSLKIGGIDQGVERIGREFCSLNPRVKGFRSLAMLSLNDMHQLQEWSGVDDGEFPCLKTLTIWSAFELRFVPLVPFISLRRFQLYDCRNLATFPTAPALQELSITKCENLEELPALSALESLHLGNCPNLVTLGHFPLLTKLDLQAPFKEEILYRLITYHLLLEQLRVWNYSLMSIHFEPQSLPSLTELSLNCPNLRYCNNLGSLTSLKILNITGSSQLDVPDSLRSQLEKLIDV
ncbi:unnamed protein product [Urochloa decumbens]